MHLEERLKTKVQMMSWNQPLFPLKHINSKSSQDFHLRSIFLKSALLKLVLDVSPDEWDSADVLLFPVGPDDFVGLTSPRCTARGISIT